MQKRGLSQEALKLIACITMLLDHIGAVIVLDCYQQATGDSKGALLEIYGILRIIGRLAFPIYCFLLVEGSVHTRAPKRYVLRLLIAAVLAEIPYDLAIYGDVNIPHQSVMVTLLLGFFMLESMKKSSRFWVKLLIIVPFAVLANLLNTDYGARGILVIAMFALTGGVPYKCVVQFVCLWWIFSPGHLMMLNWIGGFSVTTQELATLAIVPISLYNGCKVTKSKMVQWTFYLFYPLHLTVLLLFERL